MTSVNLLTGDTYSKFGQIGIKLRQGIKEMSDETLAEMRITLLKQERISPEIRK